MVNEGSPLLASMAEEESADAFWIVRRRRGVRRSD